MSSEFPIVYIPHGGGPRPVLGADDHQALIDFLRGLGATLGQPKAIVVISAHWEEEIPTLTGAENPGLIYDYYNFPPESYTIEYPAPGAPALAQSVRQLLDKKGIAATIDPQRGFDHGLFIPLKLVYPEADIPCIQLSLRSDLDPAKHIELGRALAELRQQGVLLFGSGLSFHNLQAFFTDDPGNNEDVEFQHWLLDALVNPRLSEPERTQMLIDWRRAPHASYCHPREEHLLPLHVCYGASLADQSGARIVFDDVIMGRKALGVMWS